MPAEWAPHRATWLTWPRREGISFPNRFDAVPQVWARMCAILSPGEEVHINFFSEAHEQEIRAALAKAGLKVGQRIFLHHFPAYEPWCRDHGPIFVKNGDRLAVVDWDYNAWGGKYPPSDLDDAVPQRVADLLGLPLFQPRMVLEGGSIEVNGASMLLTTEACLLNPNRNPDLTKAEIEQRLRNYLGVEKILWLGEGIVGDDTDGHIDDIARFVDERTVVAAIEEDPADENYDLLRENRRRLESEKALRIIDLPMPGPVFLEGQRLPASYANFYIANEVVLLPVFGHRNDERARAILQNCFPTRRVVPMDSRDLIWGLGSFHCATQQQPV
ncbi:MAG TPA: agmatine deiminase family protein [Thermoanaerobaculia bacterium]|nr:agmatine deiminase family protein [Thermoanaerobaculia bacterium]